MIDTLSASDVTDIVSIGIGGSDLSRLDGRCTGIGGRSLSRCANVNVDGNAAQLWVQPGWIRAHCGYRHFKDVRHTETLLNGGIVRQWLGDDARLFAVAATWSASPRLASHGERTLYRCGTGWVDVIYSLWSAVGFPIALALGMNREQLLSGAASSWMSMLHLHPLRQPGLARTDGRLEPQQVACCDAGRIAV
jgi:glucose-6-phosphate isomerase